MLLKGRGENAEVHQSGHKHLPPNDDDDDDDDDDFLLGDPLLLRSGGVGTSAGGKQDKRKIGYRAFRPHS